MVKKFFLLMTIAVLSSCTYNVSMAHTEGQAEDVIDDNLTNEPDVSPSFSAPVA